jgi:hypothetical protein
VLEQAQIFAQPEFDECEVRLGRGRATGADSDETAAVVEPRVLLAEWANDGDEWVRCIVGDVIATGRPLTEAGLDHAY